MLVPRLLVVLAGLLRALFVQGNAAALFEIAKAEKDPELKKRAVAHLSHMKLEGGHGVPPRGPEQADALPGEPVPATLHPRFA